MKHYFSFFRRYYFVLFLMALSQTLKANSAWNCQKDAAGKYRCTAQNSTFNQQPSPIPRKNPLRVNQDKAIGEVQNNSHQRLDYDLDWHQSNITKNVQPLNQDMKIDVSTIDADHVDFDQQNNVAHYAGAVQINQQGNQILADDLVYAIDKDQAELKGNVFFQAKDTRIFANNATVAVKKGEGSFNQIEYRLPKSRARGTATLMDLKKTGTSRFENVTYSTCEPDHDDWIFSAKSLDLDRENGVGTARSAKIKFKGVPFLYTPYLSFPLDDRRKSGILLPSIIYSNKRGLDIQLPYYFNIAENIDFTLKPRVMSKKGLMLGGELRYLNKNNRFTLNAEAIKDRDYKEGKDIRHAINFNSYSSIVPHLSLSTRINNLSDKDYLADFGQSLAASSVRHIEKRADLTFSQDDWFIRLRAQKFDTLDDAIASKNRPYSRLPQLLFSYDKGFFNGFDLALDVEYADFKHSNEKQVQGERFNFNPRLSYRLGNQFYFIKPMVDVQYSQYRLENQREGFNPNINRTTAIFSLDSGLFFERQTNWFGQAFRQTLEPRVFYVNTPQKDKNKNFGIPIFDSSFKDFTYDNLFSNNRYNGLDRISDANQLTLGIQSRFLSPSGAEVFRISIGGSHYFDDLEVDLRPFRKPILFYEKGTSSLVGEILARVTQHWKVNMGGEWNPGSNVHNTRKGYTQRSYIQLNYHGSDNHIFNIAYRLNRNTLLIDDDINEQVDISTKWALNQNYSIIARSLYSLLNDNLTEGVFGLEYQTCCWRTRFIIRDFLSDSSGERDKSLFFQFELKGLGKLGNDIDGFIERNIYGYKYRD